MAQMRKTMPGETEKFELRDNSPDWVVEFTVFRAPEGCDDWQEYMLEKIAAYADVRVEQLRGELAHKLPATIRFSQTEQRLIKYLPGCFDILVREKLERPLFYLDGEQLYNDLPWLGFPRP